MSSPNRIEQEDRGKNALTEFFEEVRNRDTPVVVERIVNDIDEIVRHVRFEGWHNTHTGEREAKKALVSVSVRKSLTWVCFVVG